MAGKDNLLAGAAAVAFFPLFLVRGARFDFWWGMCGAVGFIAGLSLVLDRTYATILSDDWGAGRAKKFLWGVLTAAFLYLAFLALNSLARFVFPSAPQDIAEIYRLKANASPARVGLLILFLIGPGEEIIWRGFLQRHWEKRWGFPMGWLLATALYAAIHLGSGNPMLVLAAAAAGFFWGFLYHRFGSVLLNAVSHTVWDLLVFMMLPFSS